MEEMIFPMGSVPVSVTAKVYGKDACWVRAGIILGWLPIGKATRNGKEITSLDEMDSRPRTHQLLYFSEEALGAYRIRLER